MKDKGEQVFLAVRQPIYFKKCVLNIWVWFLFLTLPQVALLLSVCVACKSDLQRSHHDL